MPVFALLVRLPPQLCRNPTEFDSDFELLKSSRAALSDATVSKLTTASKSSTTTAARVADDHVDLQVRVGGGFFRVTQNQSLPSGMLSSRSTHARTHAGKYDRAAKFYVSLPRSPQLSTIIVREPRGVPGGVGSGKFHDCTEPPEVVAVPPDFPVIAEERRQRSFAMVRQKGR